MKKHMKFCVVCGRRIPKLSLRKMTCSGFCRKMKIAGHTPYIDVVKNMNERERGVE